MLLLVLIRRADDTPELVVIQVYITSAYRSYALADYYRQRGAYVCLGGLHVTSLPQEAAPHADSIFLGPGDDTFPQFLKDFRAGHPKKVYTSLGQRSIEHIPPIRRDLISDTCIWCRIRLWCRAGVRINGNTDNHAVFGFPRL